MYFFFIFLSIFHGFLRCPFSVFDLFGWFLGFVWIWRDLFFKKLYLLPCCWNSFCLVCWLVIEKCKLSILLVEKIWKSCKKRCQFGFFSLLYFFLRVEVFFFFLLKFMVVENEASCVKVELGSFELKFDIVVFPIPHDYFTGNSENQILFLLQWPACIIFISYYIWSLLVNYC